MARIAGINIPLNKRVEVGMTYIYGIGRPTANRLLKEAGINPDTYVRELTDDEVSKLRDLIDSELTVEGDLRRERSQNIKRLMEIGCYRGLRIAAACPFTDRTRRTTLARARDPSACRSRARRRPPRSKD
jgi:small subunit ribosomal protein S13